MNIGMLWYDPDPGISLDTKVERAAVYYRNKYGCNPGLCYVHPSMLASEQPEKRVTPAGVELRSSGSVMPKHFWIGLGVEV